MPHKHYTNKYILQQQKEGEETKKEEDTYII